jgi:uncharacterized damage-inducible protein DinB
MTDIALTNFYKGWENYQGHLIKAIAPLTPEQLALRAAPKLRSIGTLAMHIIGARIWWLHNIMGEDSPDLAPMLTWDDAIDPVTQSAAELVKGLEVSWRLMADCLARWTFADLDQTFTHRRRNGEVNTFSRQWIIWHLIEHDLHHGGELCYSLGMYGLDAPDI